MLRHQLCDQAKIKNVGLLFTDQNFKAELVARKKKILAALEKYTISGLIFLKTEPIFFQIVLVAKIILVSGPSGGQNGGSIGIQQTKIF